MAATDLLHLLDESSFIPVKGCFSKCGPEQEFFLIDKVHYLARPDLIHVKRAVIGDHQIAPEEYVFQYNGETPGRALALLQEAEIELSKLGIPILARHKEVAPRQFEMAPIFEPSSLACDHNMLMMNILTDLASKYSFEVLFHEKPFPHVNGSGKHVNYSVHIKQTEGIEKMMREDDNLLVPGDTSLENMRFMVFLSAMVRGIHLHGDLLLASVICPGNEERLGGHEAPPPCISVYLGIELDKVCKAIITDSDEIRLGVSVLPKFPRDMSDMNRISPIAFNGNRFEFRAVGASQSIAPHVTIFNTILADSCRYMADLIFTNLRSMDRHSAIHAAVKEVLSKHYAVVYHGDSTEEFAIEATKRKLAYLTNVPEAVDAFDSEQTLSLFERNGVLSRREQIARTRIWRERYLGTIVTEARVQLHMARTMVLPAATKHEAHLCSILLTFDQLDNEGGLYSLECQRDQLVSFSGIILDLLNEIERMSCLLEEISHDKSDINVKFEVYHPKLRSLVREIRDRCALIERHCDADLWTIPTFDMMLV